MTDARTAVAASGTAQVSMLTLAAFVVGSMVGAGVFSLPGGFTRVADAMLALGLV